MTQDKNYPTVEDLGRHLWSVHLETTNYAMIACEQWAAGSNRCPLCEAAPILPPNRPIKRAPRR